MRFFDLHCDTPYRMFHEHLPITSPALDCPLPSLLRFERAVQVMAVWSDAKKSEEENFADFFRIAEYLRNEIEKHADVCALETDLRNLSDVHEKTPPVRYILAVEGGAPRGAVTVDGKAVAVGNARLMKKLNLTVPEVNEVGTVVHVAIDGKYAGSLLIADVVKPHSAKAIRELKHAGVRKTVMLTGDAEPVAKAVANELGLDEYHAGLLPGDKVDRIESLLAAKQPKENLAFVGDGINDAPVLSRADIGIAMGALGSDAAIEAADIVLMDDDPAKIALAMRIARRTKGIVYQNIVFALAVKAACLLLGAIGMASMWKAIFADVGVMVIAVLNATRALYTKDLVKKNEA